MPFCYRSRVIVLTTITILFGFKLQALAQSGVPARKATAPEFGGLSALPAEKTEAVPLVNGGFEQDWAGWTPQKQEGFSIVAQLGAAHAGQRCLKFDGARPTPYVPSVQQSLKDLGPGVYRLRF